MLEIRKNVQLRTKILVYDKGKMDAFVLFIFQLRELNAEYVICPYIFDSNVDP